MRKRTFVLFGLALFIVPFSLYALRVAPTIYGGDSGDLITAAYRLGGPHPPGYPLYTLIGHLFTLLPFGPSVAWKVNLSSAFFSAATVPVVFVTIWLITKRILPSLLGATLLAFSFTFFFYALYAEVFPLNTFLASLLILFAVLLWQTKRKVWFFCFGVTLAVALFHHQTILLYAPAFLFFFLSIGKTSKLKIRDYLWATLFVAMGFLIYFYPLLAAKYSSAIVWNEPSGIGDILRLYFRADYGFFGETTRFGVGGGTFMERLTQVLLYFKFLIVDFTLVGLVLLFGSFAILFLKKRLLAIFLFLAFLFAGPLFLPYANFPREGAFEIGVIERFLPLSFLIVAITLGIGVSEIAILAQRFLAPVVSGQGLKKFLTVGLEGVFLLLPATLILVNPSKIDLSQNYIGKVLAEDILLTPEKNAILLLRGDTVVFNGEYLYFVEKERNDLRLIAPGRLSRDWYYQKTLPKLYNDLALPQSEDAAKRIELFLRENAQKFAVYQYGPNITPQGYSWVPVGFLHKLYPNDKVPKLSDLKKENQRIWRNYRPPQVTSSYRDLNFAFARELYGEARLSLGNFLFQKKLIEDARLEFENALSLYPELREARINLGVTLGLQGRCQESLSQFEKVLGENIDDYLTLEHISILYTVCFKNEQKAKEFEEKSKAARERTVKQPALERF